MHTAEGYKPISCLDCEQARHRMIMKIAIVRQELQSNHVHIRFRGMFDVKANVTRSSFARQPVILPHTV